MMVPRPDPSFTAPRREPEPTYVELRARNLLAQSLISHRLNTQDPDVAAVLAVLRGDLTLTEVG